MLTWMVFNGQTGWQRAVRGKGEGWWFLLMTDRWCNSGHITVTDQVCSKDTELSAVSMRPCYLPREFTQVIVFTVHMPPSANAAAPCDVLHSVTSSVKTQHPQVLFLISGDFNHASPSSTLSTFTQYVTCHTRENKTLNLLYAKRD